MWFFVKKEVLGSTFCRTTGTVTDDLIAAYQNDKTLDEIVLDRIINSLIFL